jgi:hypothetical protein
MSAQVIVTGDIGLAVTADISPCGPCALMAAPPVECWVIFVVESTVSLVVGGPMSSHGVITDHVDLAVTVDVSILGVGTSMSAPAS